jgi:hypothetical protein
MACFPRVLRMPYIRASNDDTWPYQYQKVLANNSNMPVLSAWIRFNSVVLLH